MGFSNKLICIRWHRSYLKQYTKHTSVMKAKICVWVCLLPHLLNRLLFFSLKKFMIATGFVKHWNSHTEPRDTVSIIIKWLTDPLQRIVKKIGLYWVVMLTKEDFMNWFRSKCLRHNGYVEGCYLPYARYFDILSYLFYFITNWLCFVLFPTVSLMIFYIITTTLFCDIIIIFVADAYVVVVT